MMHRLGIPVTTPTVTFSCLALSSMPHLVGTDTVGHLNSISVYCSDMAASNLTNNSPCSSTPEGEWYIQAGQKVYYAISAIIGPISVILGSIVHCLSLKAYITEAKKEGAYTYQIFLTCVRLFLVLAMLFYIIPYNLWHTPTSPGPDWYKSCFLCMWSMAHIGLFLTSTSVTLCEVSSFLVSADRFYALCWPVSYNVLSNRRKWTMAIFCVLVSISLNMNGAFTYEVLAYTGQDGSVLYKADLNIAYMSSSLGSFLLMGKNIFEGILLFLLYVCNVGMLWFFRVRRMEASKTVLTTQQALERYEMEKTLALLAIFQSICTTTAVTHRFVFVVLIYFGSMLSPCTSDLHRAFVPVSTVIMDMADFFCLLVISKLFRKMIRSALVCKKRNSVVPTSNELW